MEERLQNSLDALTKYLENMTEEQRQEMIEHFKDDTPKGWLSIEDHLPMLSVGDFLDKGYSEVKIRYADGSEGVGRVCDHNTWYYQAKEDNITHWFNP